jgi:uncharacterized protein YcfL
MKIFNLTFAVLCLSLAACNSSNENQDNSSSDANQQISSTIEPNGPEVEINVLNFDIQKRETNIEINNRLDEPITSISGRLNFYDAEGKEVTTATGRDLSSPFQTSARLRVVGSMTSTEKKLGNKIPDGAASIQVKDVTGKTPSGTF